MIAKSSDIIKSDLKHSVIDFSDKLGYVSIRLGRMKNYNIILLKLFLKSIVKKYFNINSMQKSNNFWIECLSFINNSRVGARFNFLKNIYFLKDRDSIYIVNGEKSYDKTKTKIQFGKQNKLDLGTAFVNDRKIDGLADKYSFAVSSLDFQNGIFARKWRHGDRVKLDKGTKMVSDLFIDFKLPLFKKNIYPVFENSSMEIVWIPGIYIKKQSNTLKKIVINWKE
jgi:tRNA(Ile)-lysidine synthetase-like protein